MSCMAILKENEVQRDGKKNGIQKEGREAKRKEGRKLKEKLGMTMVPNEV